MDRATLLAELNGTTCRCGRTKKQRQSFCLRCYYLLPATYRRRLYNIIGSGYEEAYEASARLLDQIR